MPSFDNYSYNYQPYEGLFYTMVACRLITTLSFVYDLSRLEIFFVDWEKTEVNIPIKLT